MYCGPSLSQTGLVPVSTLAVGSPHPPPPPVRSCLCGQNRCMGHPFIDLFSSICESLSNYSCKVILLGDLNIDVLQYNVSIRATELLDILFSFGLLQVVTKPTRCNDNSATLIDHVITNLSLECYQTHILTSRISDHFPLIFSIPLKNHIVNKQKTFTSRFFSKASEISF